MAWVAAELGKGDVPDLLRKIDGHTATVAGKQERLATADLQIVTVPPDLRIPPVSSKINRPVREDPRTRRGSPDGVDGNFGALGAI